MKSEPKEEQLYCSLDIETSGFDPLKNEVLEVGFVLFEVKDNKLEIKEEWTQVFKPHGEVPVSILGLTGITMEELSQAKPFSEYKEELQEKLGKAVVVGHNVTFDIKFLEAVGIRFSGKVVDTLDLVQFILPTHHSYNLENLTHYFGVSHPNAHRALADSKAALTVLEKMLRVFQGFAKELREKVIRISEDQGFLWAPLLRVPFEPLTFERATSLTPQLRVGRIHLENDTVYNFPLGEYAVESVAAVALQQKQPILLVFPKYSGVLRLWKQGGLGAEFLEEQMFDVKKLTKLETKKNLSPEQARFVLKLLVWQHTNWQTETILDLNLSFFGGQFRSLVTGKKTKEQKDQKVVCCEMQAFRELAQKKLYKNRLVVFVGLSEFEQYISAGMSMKLSWSYMMYILKSFYNSDIGSGDIKFKDHVSHGLAATDLFFGLVQALLRDGDSQFQYVAVSHEIQHSQNFGKIRSAAEHYRTTLRQLNDVLVSEEISRFASELEGFFEEQDNIVKWIELAETRCVFFSSPLDISSLVRDMLAPYKKVSFADALGSQKILGYFTKRLGLSGHKVMEVAVAAGEKPEKFKQGDLFHSMLSLGKSLVGSRPVANNKIHCHIQTSPLELEKIVSLLTAKTLPAAVLLGSQMQIKEFYDTHYKQLQKSAFLLNHSASGGSNKVFHNFSIHPNSLLIGSGKLILKHLQSSGGLNPIEHLPVKTLVLCHLPFEQFTHPYQEALSARFSNAFEEFSLPKAVYNLHSILQFFYSDKLENLYICDSKLSKGYAGVFREYIKQIPGIEVLE